MSKNIEETEIYVDSAITVSINSLALGDAVFVFNRLGHFILNSNFGKYEFTKSIEDESFLSFLKKSNPKVITALLRINGKSSSSKWLNFFSNEREKKIEKLVAVFLEEIRKL